MSKPYHTVYVDEYVECPKCHAKYRASLLTPVPEPRDRSTGWFLCALTLVAAFIAGAIVFLRLTHFFG